MRTETPAPASSNARELVNSRLNLRRLLLGCGIIAFPLYFGMDLCAALMYEGYSYTDQTISELSAIGAPTRAMWVPLGFIYSLLIIAFAFGVWQSAGEKRFLGLVASLVGVTGILSLLAWPFAPMHQREVLAAGGSSLSDTMHLALAAVDSLLFILILAFGAAAVGMRFRVYSITTIVVVLIFGAFTGLNAAKVQDNDPTPWLGVAERIAVFGPMVWMAVLAILLWGAQIVTSSRTMRASVSAVGESANSPHGATR